MRVLLSSAVVAALSLAAPARACGVDVSPFGGGSAAREPTPAFLFASGGIATRRPSETDGRSMTPLLMAGLGAEVYARNGVHFAPMFDVLVRSRANGVTSTDLALVSRVSSDGFNNGGFGAALDLGLFARAHGGRAMGTLAGLTLGAPAGLQASWFVQQGHDDVRGFAVTLGFDVARLK